MNIKIGDKVNHGGQDFTVINIKHEAAMEGYGLLIQCVDPESADHMQQNKMKVDQVGENILNMVRKALEGGGTGGFGIGFPMGGGE